MAEGVGSSGSLQKGCIYIRPFFFFLLPYLLWLRRVLANQPWGGIHFFEGDMNRVMPYSCFTRTSCMKWSCSSQLRAAVSNDTAEMTEGSRCLKIMLTWMNFKFFSFLHWPHRYYDDCLVRVAQHSHCLGNWCRLSSSCSCPFTSITLLYNSRGPETEAMTSPSSSTALQALS